MITAVLVLARAVHIGSAMLLVALPFFMLVILRPGLEAEQSEGYSEFCGRIIQTLWLAFILEAISGLVWFWFVTAQMSDQSPWGVLDAADLNTVLWRTQFGQLWMGRAVIGVALGVALAFASRRGIAGQPLLSRAYPSVLITGSVMLVTVAWAGHAASGIHYYGLHLIADTLHLLIGAVWPVGLIPMGGFLWCLQQEGKPVLSGHEADALRRFSNASVFAVLVLIATGIINGWLMVGSWNALVTTPYGELLLFKVSVVAIMIGLGGFNRFCLVPRMEVEPNAHRTLRGTVFAESGLAAVVLLIIGTMGMTAPPS
jgi:putative copper resistance protein D